MDIEKRGWRPPGYSCAGKERDRSLTRDRILRYIGKRGGVRLALLQFELRRRQALRVEMEMQSGQNGGPP